MSERGDWSGKKRRRAGLAWLAIVSLLIDALLPTAITAAAAPPTPVETVYCGARPGQSGPTKRSPTAPRHCVLCLTAVAGIAPAPSPGVLAPGFAEIAIVKAVVLAAEPKPPDHAATQPRGPPVAM